MSPYESIGETATKILVKSAEVWPKAIGLQSDLAFDVKKYQERKTVGREVGSWFCEEENGL